LSESKAIQSKLVEKALGAMEQFDEKADPLRHLASYIIERQQ
jgi:geranylgeranyl pyrophosphate synthase